MRVELSASSGLADQARTVPRFGRRLFGLPV